MKKPTGAILASIMGIQAIAPTTAIVFAEETNQYEQAVADAQAKIDSLEEEKTLLEAQIAEIQTQIQEYEDQMDAELENQVGAELEALKVQVTQKILDLDTQIKGIEEAIKQAQTDVETQKNIKDTLTTTLSKDKKALTTAKNELADAQTAVDDAQTAVDKAQASVDKAQTAYDKAKQAYDDAVNADPNATKLADLEQAMNTAKAEVDKCEYLQGVYGYLNVLKDKYVGDTKVLANITKAEKYLKSPTLDMQDRSKTYDLTKAKIDTKDIINSAHIENVKEALEQSKEIADKRQADTEVGNDNTKNIRLLFNPSMMAISIRNVETHNQILSYRKTMGDAFPGVYTYNGVHFAAYQDAYEIMSFEVGIDPNAVDSWYDRELSNYQEYNLVDRKDPWGKDGYFAEAGGTGHYHNIMDDENLSIGGAKSNYSLRMKDGSTIDLNEFNFANGGTLAIQNFGTKYSSDGSIPIDEAYDAFNTWYTKVKDEYTPKNEAYEQAKDAYELALDASQGLQTLKTKMDTAKKTLDKAKTTLNTATTNLNTANTTLTNAETKVDKAQKKVATTQNSLNTATQDLETAQNELKTQKSNLTPLKTLSTQYTEVKGYLDGGADELGQHADDEVPADISADYQRIASKAKTIFETELANNEEYNTAKTEQIKLQETLAQTKEVLSQAKMELKSAQTKLDAYNNGYKDVKYESGGGHTGLPEDKEEKTKINQNSVATGIEGISIMIPAIVGAVGVGMTLAHKKKR